MEKKQSLIGAGLNVGKGMFTITQHTLDKKAEQDSLRKTMNFNGEYYDEGDDSEVPMNDGDQTIQKE